MVMFNGESKVFEIKTEYDSPRRLDRQMGDYKGVFDKCYLVVPESKVGDYLQVVEEETGIIVMAYGSDGMELREWREARQNEAFNSYAMLSCLRACEYERMAENLGHDLMSVLKGINGLITVRISLLRAAAKDLKRLFLQEVKKRQNNTRFLSKYPVALRQMLLSLNLPEKKALLLLDKLKTTIQS